MLQISAELLAMSSDAAILARNNKVLFANGAAKALLGHDCEGKTLRSIFGPELPSTQASSFIGEIILDGERHIIRKKSSDGISAIFLTGLDQNESMLNDAFVFALRNCLMNIDVALNLLRLRLEELPELSESVYVNAAAVVVHRYNAAAFCFAQVDADTFAACGVDHTV